MSWRIVEVPESQTVITDLTDSEMAGVSILVGQCMGKPFDFDNVYFRAWKKIHPVGIRAIENDDK